MGSFKNGACEEGESVLWGQTCTPTCSSGAPSSTAKIFCPSGTGESPPDNGWWGHCGVGPACAKLEIGVDVTCTMDNSNNATDKTTDNSNNDQTTTTADVGVSTTNADGGVSNGAARTAASGVLLAMLHGIAA